MSAADNTLRAQTFVQIFTHTYHNTVRAHTRAALFICIVFIDISLRKHSTGWKEAFY